MTSLFTDGYMILSCENTPKRLEETILPLLPPGYVFLDYKYTIRGPALITYHRDVTSSQSFFHTKYPTYTAIHYDYEGEFLSVSPGSHRKWQWNLPLSLGGQRDTLLLFNCDLVHGGIDAPLGVERKATQYKIAHSEDIPLLQEIQGVDVFQEGTSIGFLTKWFLRIGSYLFTVPIEIFFGTLLQRRVSQGLSAYIQRTIPLQYFNNPQGSHEKQL